MKLLLILLIVCFAGTPEEPIKWHTDLDSGLENARKNNRPVIIYIGAKWCAPCGLLDKELFAEPNFADYTRQFQMIKVYDNYESGEVEKKEKYWAAWKKYGIKGIPAFITIKKGRKPCKFYPSNYSSFEQFKKDLEKCK